MFFGYIIQFLAALFLYLGQPQPRVGAAEPLVSLTLAVGLLVAYGLLSRIIFGRLSSTLDLNRWESRLAWLAVAVFGAEVYGLELRAVVWQVPGAAQFSALDGLIGLGLYYLHLLLLWSAQLRGLRRLADPGLSLPDHLLGQVRWTLPLLLPWFLMAVALDLLDLLAPAWLTQALATTLGEMGLAAAILIGLSLFLPPLVTKAWGCRPVPAGPLREVVERFLAFRQVQIREILTWPLLQGRLVTAGVMGLLPRFRYLLLTPSLVEAVTAEELLAILAHETAHLKRRHLWLYLLFFLGYVILAYSLGGLVLSGVFSLNPLMDWLLAAGSQRQGWFTVIVSAPLALLLVAYFRFVFAWFMRHFERQADADAALTVGPAPVAAALERIAGRSGLDRRTPSWHHFSVAERVDFLAALAADPAVAARHDRRLRRGLGLYLAGVVLAAGLAWPTGLLDTPEGLNLKFVLAGLNRAVATHPQEPQLQLYRAMVLVQLGRPREAVQAYEATLKLAPRHPTALNDLAWLLLTGPAELQDPPRALGLARQATALEPNSPAILDTLAEACFRNDRPEEALRWAEAALAANPKDNRKYFEGQINRFRKAVSKKNS